jgi:hypothetical protein
LRSIEKKLLAVEEKKTSGVFYLIYNLSMLRHFGNCLWECRAQPLQFFAVTVFAASSILSAIISFFPSGVLPTTDLCHHTI